MKRFSFQPNTASAGVVAALQQQLSSSTSNLASAIAQAKAEAISEAESKVSEASTSLTEAINSRASVLTSVINSKESALQAAIDSAEQSAISAAQSELITARQALKSEIDANKLTSDSLLQQTAEEIATNGLTDEQQSILIQGVTNSVAEVGSELVARMATVDSTLSSLGTNITELDNKLELEKAARMSADNNAIADLSTLRTDLENLEDDTIAALTGLGVISNGVVTFPHPSSQVQDWLDSVGIGTIFIEESVYTDITEHISELSNILDYADDQMDNNSTTLQGATLVLNAFAIWSNRPYRVVFENNSYTVKPV